MGRRLHDMERRWRHLGRPRRGNGAATEPVRDDEGVIQSPAEMRGVTWYDVGAAWAQVEMMSARRQPDLRPSRDDVTAT